jgi:hypothetical protein
MQQNNTTEKQIVSFDFETAEFRTEDEEFQDIINVLNQQLLVQ